MKSIAVLITCFNRKAKTLNCIQNIYAQRGVEETELDIYIVDGGSNDGTPEAIRKAYPQVNVYVENGLFWAGGMRAAWKKALEKKNYDYYWLLNDDTQIYSDCLQECLKADKYSLQIYGKQGVYVGSTKTPNTEQFSYGGRKLLKSHKSTSTIIIPDGKTYQTCELGNANIMMVSQEVFNTIGGFCERYTHGIADYDYSLRATRAGFPVLVLPNYEGECEDDHGNNWKSQSSSLKERIKYLYSPKGLAYKEYLTYIKEFFPKEFQTQRIKLWVKTLFPVLWDKFKNKD